MKLRKLELDTKECNRILAWNNSAINNTKKGKIVNLSTRVAPNGKNEGFLLSY